MIGVVSDYVAVDADLTIGEFNVENKRDLISTKKQHGEGYYLVSPNEFRL